MMRIILIASFGLLLTSIGFVQPVDALTFKKDEDIVSTIEYLKSFQTLN